MFAGRSKLPALSALLGGILTVIVVAPSSVAHAEPSLSEIEAELERAGDALEDVVEAYNKINGDLAATQAATDELAARMRPLQADMERAHENVDEIAVVAYKSSSRLRNVSLLLSAGSSDALMDQVTTLQQLSRHQQQDLAAFTEAKQRLDAEQKRLDDLRATQNAQKAELETKRTKIQADVKKLEELRRKAIAAGRRTTTTTTSTNTTPPPVSGSAGTAVRFAYAQLGKPYQWGADGPNSYDCSGLTMAAWLAAGVRLPHNAAQQWYTIRHISRSQLAPGDLVFYRNLGHVGIYVGSGQIIHAPSTGDVVTLAGVDRQVPYGYGRPG